jgi:hypothetical protein
MLVVLLVVLLLALHRRLRHALVGGGGCAAHPGVRVSRCAARRGGQPRSPQAQLHTLVFNAPQSARLLSSSAPSPTPPLSLRLKADHGGEANFSGARSQVLRCQVLMHNATPTTSHPLPPPHSAVGP